MLTEKQLEEFYDSLSEAERRGQLLQLDNSYFGADGVMTGEATNWKFTAEDVANVGSLIMGLRHPVERLRTLQEEHMKHCRVPLLFMADIISGYMVSLPFPLAQACSFDTGMVKRLARAAADAATAHGLNVTFSPMVDISRDARWGRCLESYGEDVLLGSRMARAMVEGYQGEDSGAPDSLSACVKHFAAYGYAEAGRDYNNVELSERALRETFLPAYRAAVEAGCDLVMSSFNTIGGVPTNLDPHLMREVLREEWGFDGVNITDWCSLLQCKNHRAVNSEQELARFGLESGIDICMMDYIYTAHIPALLESGAMDESLFREAVMRVLRLKNKKGLLEDPYRYLSGRPIDAGAQYALALEAVEKSCVLLKNDGGTLPLDADARVALIGPYAVRRRAVSMWNTNSHAGLEMSKMPKEAFDAVLQQPVLCERGCTILEKDHFLMKAETEDADCLENPQLYMQRALHAAAAADTVVMMLGEHTMQSGESASRAEISLPAPQLELLRRVHEVNANIVTVVYTGRPLDLREVKTLSRAILLAWCPADAGSEGVANLLTGRANPTAKLAMSFPYHAGQCPIHYDLYPTGHPSKGCDHRFSSRYVDLPNTPLYPFGYGLSYTAYDYSGITASSPTMTAEQPLYLTVTVTNTGERAGEEIVQLYLRDETATRVSRPLRELKDFCRVPLEPGESREVTFTVTEEMLRFYQYDGSFASEPGMFTAYIGGSSDAAADVQFELL